MADESTPTTSTTTNPNLDLAARLGAKARSYRDKFQAASARVAELEAAAKTSGAELAGLRERASESAQAKQIAALTAELRSVNHRRVFDRLAAEAGVASAAVGDLWTLSGYQAEADEADETAIKTLIDGQKTARPHLFGGADQAAEPPVERLPPGPGANRGSGAKAPQEFTEAQLSDPVFVMKNFDRIAAACKEKSAG